MRIEAVQIHNFRTFDDSSFSFKSYSSLVGANNSGKSNLIDAIRVFYQKDLKYVESRDFPKFDVGDHESWIEIEYRPADDELGDLKDEYRLPGGTFRVRNYLQSDETDAEGKKRTGIYAYVGGELSEGRFYGAKNVQAGKLGSLVYIPAVSKLDDATKLSGPSPLRDLLNTVVKQVMQNSKSYASLVEAFTNFEGAFKTEETQDGRSLQTLEQEVTEEIRDWGTEFQLEIQAVAPDDVVKGLVTHTIFDTELGQSQDSPCYGQGFQRHLIFTLIRLAARYTAPRPQGKRKEFAPDMTLILFEEPEAFLHPAQIDVLDFSMRELASADPVQVLISTHSPLFVSRSVDDLPALTRLHCEGRRSRAFQVDAACLQRVFTLNQEEVRAWKEAGVPVEEDDLELEMEAIKYSLWLDPRRCGGFFANRVLLVEGRTETALIDRLFRDGHLEMPRDGVFVFDSIGKYNIHRFMNLFGALGIRHGVLFDGDSGKRAVIAETIKGAKNDWTLGIDLFEDDLETFLGIPKPKSKHRKPQHVMYQFGKGAIAEDRITALCEKVAAVLGL